MPSMRRGRRPLPSVAPGHHTAKGAVRGAAKAEAVAVGAVSPATAGSLSTCRQQRHARVQKPQSRQAGASGASSWHVGKRRRAREAMRTAGPQQQASG